jgi:hypothetical protein
MSNSSIECVEKIKCVLQIVGIIFLNRSEQTSLKYLHYFLYVIKNVLYNLMKHKEAIFLCW